MKKNTSKPSMKKYKGGGSKGDPKKDNMPVPPSNPGRRGLKQDPIINVVRPPYGLEEADQRLRKMENLKKNTKPAPDGMKDLEKRKKGGVVKRKK